MGGIKLLILRIMKKIITWLINLVLALLVVLGVVLLFSMIPLRGNYKLLVVTSGSMEPLISTGSVVVVRPTDHYQVGDVITYRARGNVEKDKIVTHRIIDVEWVGGAEDSYVVKGDANETADPYPIKKSEVIGKYYYKVAGIGYIVGYAKTLPGIVVIIVLATIIIYEETKKIKKEIFKIRKNNKPKKRAKNDKKN